jgi:phospholipid transport system substrate-binding protein
LKTILTLFVGLIITSATFADDTGAMQALQTPLDKILALLQDPLYQEKDRQDLRQEKIREIINTIFDFDAISRRAVGRSWKRFSQQEKIAFTAVFSDLLGNSYISKIQGAFKNQRVTYLGERSLSDVKSLVKTQIAGEDLQTPVDYSMRRRNSTWKIYDVNIEGVSLVKNYRSQFNTFLSRKKPAQLIQQVKEKVEKQAHKGEVSGN